MLVCEEVHLRAVQNKDAAILYKAINNPDLVRFNATFKPVDEINHLEWMANILKDKSKEIFIIEIEGMPVGCIQLIDINLLHRNAELVIRLFDKEYFGKGIGSKAIKVLCHHSFIDLGLERVWLRVFSSNARAIAAYKRAGFLIEGVMKKAAFVNGKFEDVVWMAILNNSVIGLSSLSEDIREEY